MDWLTTVYMCIFTATTVNLFELATGSGQLTKTDSCTCPEGIITYVCVINGNGPGGFTIWQGTAFNCQSNHILLRNNLFGTSGAFGSCNNGIISGRSLGVSEGNVYTSQLQVTITSGSRSDLIGRTVECVYSPDGSTNNLINSTTITITDPLPPPLDVQLTSVKPNELTFNWSSVQQNCSTLQYGIVSNCGTCTNDLSMQTYATCSFELSAISGGLCNFSIQSTVCGDITGSLSTPVTVTLRVPGSPVIQSVIPTYNTEGVLIRIEVSFTDMESFNISSSIDGSALYYIMNFTDSNTKVCNSSNISASSCMQSICTVPSVDLTACSQAGNIDVSVSAFNLLGSGPASLSMIESTNRYVDVTFESTERVVCTFSDQAGNQNKSCDLTYGTCQQNQKFNMIIRGTMSLNSPNIVIINLTTQLSSSDYCYVILANNGTFTVQMEGTFGGDKGQRNANTAIIAGILVPLVIVSVVVVVVILIVILVLKPWRTKLSKSTTDDQERHVLLEVDAVLPEYEDVQTHIVFNIKDKPEELVKALNSLSDIINIKNIKISPFEVNESEKKICIECDHDLTKEQEIQIKEQTKLGLPGTKNINLKAETERVIKDEEESKHLAAITEDLQHQKGALCSLLKAIQDTEECKHIRITDIVHEPIEGRDDCKRVTVKFLPQLPTNWKDRFDEKKRNYEHIILPKEDNSNL